MSRFGKVFSSVKCAVIGMIHVQALPGTPMSKYSVQQIVEYACNEAIVYGKCGVDGLIVENMFDVPYVSGNQVGHEVTAVMTRVCTEVKKTIGKMPCGVQILSGNNIAATAVALAAGLQFARIEGFVFAHVADEGLMEACAGPLLRYARNIGARDILYLCDIKKKHCSHAITSDLTISQTARAAEFFLSDGVILTGMETGNPPDVKDLEGVKTATSLPVLIGSGMTIENVKMYAKADGFIVGSHFKHNGHWSGQADSDKILKFMETVSAIR
ncbi:uncharacterized protein F13E9.13, mitochondrial-like isoform X2 [Stegodyphus dumicola]|nr:uncharacterized protein F13E9.13, mitochondrial-like isoform X2 [Stegodyphus dumicola]XP_035214742.1 uncharacterized protein F13E9.13, mitochondrial-like isoform X2 [Stegodyphus dumicola]